MNRLALVEVSFLDHLSAESGVREASMKLCALEILMLWSLIAVELDSASLLELPILVVRRLEGRMLDSLEGQRNLGADWQDRTALAAEKMAVEDIEDMLELDFVEAGIMKVDLEVDEAASAEMLGEFDPFVLLRMKWRHLMRPMEVHFVCWSLQCLSNLQLLYFLLLGVVHHGVIFFDALNWRGGVL